MYDELVKRLREAPSDWYDAELHYEAADTIEDLIAALTVSNKVIFRTKSKPQWIPVTGQPPLKVGDDGYNGYLVFANGYYEIADYSEDRLDGVPVFCVNGEYEPDVTHWQPLPDPPKEADE